MAINRYTNRQPVNVDFYKTPLEPMFKSLAMKQQKFDEIAAGYDALKLVNINSLDVDRDVANNLIAGYQGKIEESVGKYDGDYSKMGRELAGLTTTIKKDFLPGGHAANIQSRLTQMQEAQKFNQERLGKDIVAHQLGAWNSYVQQNLTPYDMSGKGSLNLPTITAFKDGDEMLNDALKLIEHDAQAVGGTVHRNEDGSLFIVRQGKKEFISPEKVMNVVAGLFSGNMEWNSYMDQLAQFTGQDAREMKLDAIESYATRGIASKAFTRYDLKTDFKINPVWVKGQEMELENDAALSWRYSPTNINKYQNQTLDWRDVTAQYKFIGQGWGSEQSVQDFLGSKEGQSLPSVATETLNLLQQQEGWGLLSNKEQAKRFTDQYNANITAINNRSDLILNYGPKSSERMEKVLLNSRVATQLTYTVVGADGRVKEHSDKSPMNYTQLVEAGYDLYDGDGKPIVNFGGLRTGINDATAAAELLNRNGDRIYASGFDYALDENSKAMAALMRPSDVKYDESPPVRFGFMEDTNFKTQARNIYNPDGTFNRRQIDLYLQTIDPATGKATSDWTTQPGWTVQALDDAVIEYTNQKTMPTSSLKINPVNY